MNAHQRRTERRSIIAFDLKYAPLALAHGRTGLPKHADYKAGQSVDSITRVKQLTRRERETRKLYTGLPGAFGNVGKPSPVDELNAMRGQLKSSDYKNELNRTICGYSVTARKQNNNAVVFYLNGRKLAFDALVAELVAAS